MLNDIPGRLKHGICQIRALFKDQCHSTSPYSNPLNETLILTATPVKTHPTHAKPHISHGDYSSWALHLLSSAPPHKKRAPRPQRHVQRRTEGSEDGGGGHGLVWGLSGLQMKWSCGCRAQEREVYTMACKGGVEGYIPSI